MLAKLTLLLHNKVALTVLGALLLGGGTAVAVAAASGAQVPLGQQSAAASGTQQGQDADDANTNEQEHEDELMGTVDTIGNVWFTVKLADGSTKTVTVTNQTKFKGGLHGLSDLRAGMQVEVKGSTQSDGTFAATSVEAKHEVNENQNENDNQLEGTVDSVGANSFVLKLEDGTTKTVIVSDQTEFEEVHGLSDLRAGMQVEVKGSTQSDGTFAAAKVEVKGDANDDHGGGDGGHS